MESKSAFAKQKQHSFGRPDILHFLPHIYVTTDRMISNNFFLVFLSSTTFLASSGTWYLLWFS